MATLDRLLDDLAAESAELDALVAGLDESGWRTPTPAEGWNVADQIAHLAWTDQAATLAATDPEGFARETERAMADPSGFVDAAAHEGAAQPPAVLLEQWRTGRTALAQALAAVPEGQKIPWFGPPMAAASMATARIMETWAHGLDVADALGVQLPVTDRIRSVAHIGVRTRDYAYLVNGLTAPPAPFRYELRAPGGELWTWGPEDAEDRITGSALDFCQLVTQRRNAADLDLEFTGPYTAQWAGIAQCFAGPPGPGRAPADGSGGGAV